MNSTFETKELRFVVSDELLDVYVYCGPPSDGMLGVQGWHHKTFPASVSVLEAMERMFGINGREHDDYLLWGLEAPRE